jgi:hypothetical protein
MAQEKSVQAQAPKNVEKDTLAAEEIACLSPRSMAIERIIRGAR